VARSGGELAVAHGSKLRLSVCLAMMALPLIAAHKAELFEARPRIEAAWQHEYKPGREHAGPDGRRIIATDQELIYLDGQGHITGRAPNGRPGHQLVGLERRLGIPFPVPIEVSE